MFTPSLTFGSGDATAPAASSTTAAWTDVVFVGQMNVNAGVVRIVRVLAGNDRTDI
jgi:hypothetical protein